MAAPARWAASTVGQADPLGTGRKDGLFAASGPVVETARMLLEAHAATGEFCQRCGQAAPCAVARHAALVCASANLAPEPEE
jgi:hypothetical protein